MNINTILEALKQNPKLTNFSSSVQPGLSAKAIAELEEQFGIKTGDEVKSFYKTCNGFSFEWQYHSPEMDKNNTYIEAQVRILPLHESLGGFDGRLWRNELWDKTTPPDQLAFLKRLKVFDYFDRDNVHCVCMELSEEQLLTGKLWIFRQGYAPLPIKVTVADYLNRLASTKGFWGWPYLFTEKKKIDPAVYADIGNTVSQYTDIFDEAASKEVARLLHAK